MAEFDKTKIIELRKEGKSYNEISNITKKCLSTVKSICLRDQRKAEKKEYLCKYCAKKLVFIEGKRKKIFCSDKCRSMYWKEHFDLLNKNFNFETECLCCHRVFKSYKSENKKFCSRVCYLNFKRNGGK